MSKSIDIGKMKAHLDVKTGFIRLTSKEPNSKLKKNGFVVNVMPNSKEYEMLLEAIIDKDESNGVSEHKSFSQVRLSDKYRSHDCHFIPLGLQVRPSTTMHWDVKFAPHMSIQGDTGSGKTVFLECILDHLTHHRDKTQVLYHCNTSDMIEAEKVLAMPYENIEHFNETDSSILEKAKHIIKDRYDYLERMGLNDISHSSMKEIYVVIDKLESLVIPTDENDRKDKERNKDLIAEIVRLGRAAGVHLIVSHQWALGALITSEISDKIGAKIFPYFYQMNGLNRYGADVEVYHERRKIVPFFI